MAHQQTANTFTQDLSTSDEVLLLDRRTAQRFVPFLGLDFVPLTPDALFDRVVQAGDAHDKFRFVSTPNVDQVVRLHTHNGPPPFETGAWLNVNDSRILQTLARWSGLDLPACPGSDLTAKLVSEAIDPAEPVVIIGCDEAVIDTITKRYGLKDVRWYQPPMGLKNNPAAIEATAQYCIDNPARFTFICVGNPQQEMVARAILASGKGTGVGLCVGASFEFLAGTRKRAPLWMQQARLEWLFRLLNEPKVLWKRYLVEGPKIFAIWWQWRKAQVTG